MMVGHTMVAERSGGEEFTELHEIGVLNLAPLVDDG